MRRITVPRVLAAATIAAVAAFAVLPAMAAATPGPAATAAAVPGEIVVGFRSAADASDRVAARSAADVRAKRKLLLPGAQLVKVDPGQTVAAAITALEKRSEVRYAEPNFIFHAAATTPNDPLFSSLWGLNNTGQAVNGSAAGSADADIDAPEAWDRSTGSPSVVVGVVDSGVAWDHPDLAPNIWSNPGEIAGNGIDDDNNGKVDDVRGWDFVDGDNNPWDYNDHGTHVAGTLAARGNDGVGVSGVAWQASIMPVRVLDASNSGTNANIADGLSYAADSGAKVVNASIVSPDFSAAVQDAIMRHPKTLFVVAAGNAGRDIDMGAASYPCSYTAANLICVAATDNTDALASFSNYGATSVDLAAPGVNIDSTRPHYTDYFSDDFLTGLETNWTVESGPWGTVPGSDSNWLTDSPNGNYADNADWAIRTSSKVDLGTRTDCVLKFSYETFLQQDFDWLYVQSSTDGTTWTDLGKIGDTNGLVRFGFFPLGSGSRYLRFRLTSDASVNKDGVLISKVRVACPGGTYGSGDYRFMNGTSMASPYVAGAAAVLFAAKPSATVTDVKAALLGGGDPLPGLSTKTVSGRRLNVNGALAALGKTDTTTTINSDDPDPSVTGQAVTVQYAVTPNAPGPGPPTGMVTVSDGTHSCSETVAAGACTITFAGAGPKSLTATYTGDLNYNASPAAASVSHEVDRADTTTTITSEEPDPSLVGQAVKVKVTVAAVAPGSGTPTGNVTVSDGVDSCTATVALGGCDLPLTTVGARTLTVSYDGDSNFNGSTSAAAHVVERIGTTTAIAGSSPDPSVAGQVVIVHYSVLPSGGSGTPTGNVTVSDGVDGCTGTVAAGKCAIALTTVGSRTLTAGYGGDGNFKASSSAAIEHTVGPVDSSGDEPPIVDPLVPPLAHIFGASQTRAKFRVSPKRRLPKVSRGRAPVGTIFKYNLDIAAPVRFDFSQLASGRTVNGKCVALSERNKRGPACTLQSGSLAFAGHAGLNAVRFGGWISRKKKLAPGKYTVVMTAITPGVGATSQTLAFTIVP